MPAEFGISQQWANGNYSFAGGTHPVALPLSLIIAMLYILLMFAPPAYLGEPLPGVFRRFITFWLDFILAMLVIAPIVGILPALTEWERTGTFQWHFERTVHAPGDGWLIAAGLILFITYLAPFIARDRKKGKFWLDAVFGTRALTLR